MWPREPEPRSIADGILDDETYDWRALLTAVHDSGGRALGTGSAVRLVPMPDRGQERHAKKGNQREPGDTRLPARRNSRVLVVACPAR